GMESCKTFAILSNPIALFSCGPSLFYGHIHQVILGGFPSGSLEECINVESTDRTLCGRVWIARLARRAAQLGRDGGPGRSERGPRQSAGLRDRQVCESVHLGVRGRNPRLP